VPKGRHTDAIVSVCPVGWSVRCMVCACRVGEHEPARLARSHGVHRKLTQKVARLMQALARLRFAKQVEQSDVDEARRLMCKSPCPSSLARFHTLRHALAHSDTLRAHTHSLTHVHTYMSNICKSFALAHSHTRLRPHPRAHTHTNTHTHTTHTRLTLGYSEPEANLPNLSNLSIIPV
jgi:hypothetical protein